MDFNNIKSPEELLQYMEENIEYGYVDKEGNKYYNSDNDLFVKKCYVQTGKEVLKSKIGTCWDQVELERLWFKNNKYDYKTFFIKFDLDYINDYPTHTFLIYKKENKWFWFENAFIDNRGIYEFDSLDNAINTVKNKQFEYASKYYNASKNELNKIRSYEYEELTNGLDVNGFLKHVTSIN